MNFHWTNLISLNSSQNDAFEELLCQLAKKEPIDNKKKFIKVGNPDGGVECYIILDNGDEIGFQAKWFPSTPDTGQWNQVEKSFKTAIEKHPNMIKYYVAIPLDRADPRLDNQKWFMDKWNEKVGKWKQFALDTYGREITFVYWGSSEFITRLGREENAGLRSFFFGDIDLSNDWFRKQNELSIKNLGVRYTPEINTKIQELVELFDCLDSNKLLNELNIIYMDFENSYHDLPISGPTELQVFMLLSDSVKEFNIFFENMDFSTIGYIDYNKFNELLMQLQEVIFKNGFVNIISNSDDSPIDRFQDTIYKFLEFIRDNKRELNIINNPFIFLKGEAGIGKSHLLADIVKKRFMKGLNSIFLLGQHFRQDKAPWSQILDDLLRLKCSEEEFLGALNSKAEAENHKIIIFIDAINEGKGKSFWNEFLIGFIESVKQYKWLGVVLSIRSSYFDLIIPTEFENDDTINILTHYGLNMSYEVLEPFFRYYNISYPSIPIFNPAFSNPLFLKLFCEGLQNNGLTTIPDKYEVPLYIIDFFIKGIEEKLQKKYSNIRTLKLVNKVIDLLIEQMINVQDIPYEEAYLLIEEQISSKYRIDGGLVDDLISEGLLTKNIFYSSSEAIEGVYFAYEKFEDHLKVKFLLKKYLDVSNPNKSFKQKELNQYITANYKGIVDAMCIQLPKICNIELYEFYSDSEIVFDGFLHSLTWREIETISVKTIEIIDAKLNNSVMEEKELETLLAIASNPKHPLNFNKLHNWLLKFQMNERDYHWTIYLHKSFSKNGIVKRIINWAWNKKEEFEIEDESLYLYGLTLGWFLTSSNRELRDGATKALVNLFTDRVNMFLSVLQSFEMVNDLYVLERFYAVGYGIVLRSENQNGFSNLEEYIYKTIFDKSEVVEHIFLRDYAKSTVEYINNLTHLNIDIRKILPPYNQHLDWNLSDEKIEDIEEYRDDYSRIYFSTIKGDFKKYIIYPYVNHFLNLKIKDRPYSKTPKVRYEDFINSLSEKQKLEYDKTKLQSTEMLKLLNSFSKDEHEGKTKGKDINSELKKLEEIKLKESNFKELLTHKQLKEYTDFIVTYKPAGMYANGLNVKIVKRLVFLEVLKLGWNKELFEEFDNNANFDRGRDTGTDRIGKKYQWIALYKILSKIFDTYELKEDEYKDKISKFKGMYQFSFKRDIDPTTILKFKKEKEDKWWFKLDKKFENYELSDIEWMNSSEKLPKLSNVINLIKNEKKYFLLDTNFSIDGSKDGETYRNLYYHLNSFIIKKDKEKEILDWMSKQKFYARRMPESKYFYDIYLREYPNSEAYKYINNDYNSQPNWDDRFSNANNIPDKVLLIATGYFKERGELDHSIVDSMEIKLPNKWFINNMNLKQTLKDGEWINEQKEVVFLDPTVESGNISTFNENGVLIADKNLLLNFLEENDYTIFWILWGEKQVRNNEGFNSKDFLGIAEITGYGYFNGDEFIENIDVEFERRD